MMNSISRSGRGFHDGASEGYDSAVWIDSEAVDGVRYAVARMSFGRRIELVRRIREIGRKAEFLEAGSDARDKLESAVLAGDVDRAYLEWGLVGVEGLTIDGETATPEMLIEKGPVALALEVLAKVKAECGLSEDERKN
jgi:hypothetical protein